MPKSELKKIKTQVKILSTFMRINKEGFSFSNPVKIGKTILSK